MAKDINTISSQNAKFIEIQKHFDELENGVTPVNKLLLKTYLEDGKGITSEVDPSIILIGVSGDDDILHIPSFRATHIQAEAGDGGIYNGNDFMELSPPAGSFVNVKRLAIDVHTTAARPVSPSVGMVCFDLTLGKPIWCKSINPTVWVDASGATV